MAANKNAQELAENILSLYDVTKNSDAIISKYYLPESTFSDPIVSVKGIENVKAQFRALPRFIQSSKATLIRGSMAGLAVLTIDSTFTCRLKPIPSFMHVTLRLFSVIELKNGKVATHTDHWDFHSVLSNVPFVSFFYEQFRTLFGTASSALIRKFLPSSTRSTQTITSPRSTTATAATTTATATATTT
jgi:hypothetical protein